MNRSGPVPSDAFEKGINKQTTNKNHGRRVHKAQTIINWSNVLFAKRSNTGTMGVRSSQFAS
jgi:hypothetical protein